MATESKKSASKKVCIFCGGSILGKKKSKEHYVPKWLIIHQDLENTESLCRTFDHYLVMRDAPRRNFFLANVLGPVCKTCNGGWMERLESKVRDNVKRLIAGTVGIDTLTAQERLDLARWACKVVYCWNVSANKIGRVSAAHFHSLKNQPSSLPHGVVVFASKSPLSINIDLVSAPNWKSFRISGSSDEQIHTASRLSYKFSIQFGYMLLIVCHWPDPAYHLGFVPGLLKPLCSISIPTTELPTPSLRAPQTSREFLQAMIDGLILVTEEYEEGMHIEEKIEIAHLEPIVSS